MRHDERVPEVWGTVPPRNKFFTGRTELLARLHERLAGQAPVVTPLALHGLGGVGKTQVAVEYAYRYRSEYNVVWWIPADQPLLVRSSLAGLAPRLGLPSAAASGIEDAANAVLDALRRGDPYRNWLLIFDNADRPEDVNDIILCGPGHVLITSRNHRWESMLDTVPIDVFTREESAAFLSKRLPRAIRDTEADQLAQELGDLPLALAQAGALLAETGLAVPDYLRLLAEKIGELLSEGQPTEYPRSMTAAWRLSLTSLDEKFPEAVRLLRCCAFFGPEPIPRDAFRQPTADLGMELSALIGDPIRLSRAIGELGRHALARVDIQARTLQVHRLVQALLREDVPAEDRESCRHDVHLLLAGYAQGDPHDPASWPRYGEVLSHIEPAEVARCSAPKVRTLAHNTVRYLLTTGDYLTARRFMERFLDRWIAESGEDHHDVIRLRLERTTVLRELGEYAEAAQANQEALAVAERVLGADHPITLRFLLGAGADLRASGAFAAARAHDEHILGLYRAAVGESDPDTLRALNTLALDYGLSSDYPGSRRLYEQAYLGRLSLERENPLDVLTAWSGLARAVRLCGDYAEACDLGEEAYAYGLNEVGPEHSCTLRIAKDLSVAWRRHGDYERALELAEHVHARLVRLFDRDHPDTLAAAMCLSNTYRAVGRIDDALELAEDTLRRYTGVYGSDHPYTHGCAGNLAVLLRLAGDRVSARRRNERALVGLEAGLGRDHHYSLVVATNLAGDLAGLGATEDAVALGRGTLRRLRGVLGDRHPAALRCGANLSIDLAEAGQKDAADGLCAEIRKSYEETLGAEHPDVRVFLERERLDGDFEAPPI